jgi:excinuclease ABC subunit B
MYADKTTRSMQACLDETGRRRTTQLAYNEVHGITPETVRKSFRSILDVLGKADSSTESLVAEALAEYESQADLSADIKRLKAEMLQFAADLDFEKAAELRDRILLLEKQDLALRS